MRDPPYDENIDYGLQCLEFAKQNPNFLGNPHYKDDMLTTYSEVNYLVTCGKKTKEEIHYIWYKWHMWQLSIRDKVKNDMLRIRQGLECDNHEYVFITVGFNDKKITVSAITDICDKILHVNKDFISKADYCIEKHRTDRQGGGGIIHHHHVHMLIVSDTHLRASKWVEFIYKLRGIKEYVDSPTFIDVKTPNAKKMDHRAQPYPQCLNYIKGIKTTSKMQCVALDIEWRREVGLCDHYSYVRPI